MSIAEAGWTRAVELAACPPPGRDFVEVRPDRRADDDETSRLRSFMESGGQVVGQVAGVALAVVAGPVAGAGAGAVLGEVLARVGVQVHDYLLGRLRGARAAGALDVAVVRIDERLRAGDTPRQDGFFDRREDGRVDAEEVLEGTLLTAADAWEERKVPYVGRLFANVAFDATVSPAYANFLLRLADRLTYRQLQVVAFVKRTEPGGPYYSRVARPDFGPTTAADDPGDLQAPESADATLIAEMQDMSDNHLLGLSVDEPVGPPRGAWADMSWAVPIKLGHARLAPLAEALHTLMELDKMPIGQTDEVLAGLLRAA